MIPILPISHQRLHNNIFRHNFVTDVSPCKSDKPKSFLLDFSCVLCSVPFYPQSVNADFYQRAATYNRWQRLSSHCSSVLSVHRHITNLPLYLEKYRVCHEKHDDWVKRRCYQYFLKCRADLWAALFPQNGDCGRCTCHLYFKAH